MSIQFQPRVSKAAQRRCSVCSPAPAPGVSDLCGDAPEGQRSIQSGVQGFSSNPSFSTFSGRAFRVIHTVNRQPSWVIRAAVGAGMLVLLAILAVIVVPVIAVMLAVFTIGAGLARVRRLFSPRDRTIVIVEEQPDEGRDNVRVIGRR